MSKQAYEQLTLFPGDFPASHSLQPGSAEARQMTVTSGRKCCEFVRSSSPLGLLAKMLLGSLVWQSQLRILAWKAEPLPATRKRTITKRYYHDKKGCCSTVSVKTLKISDTKSSRLLFRLVVSEPTTSDTESQLWVGTPTATFKERSERFKRPTLNPAEYAQMWKTPTAEDSANRAFAANSRGEPKLSAQVKMWPTPSAMDAAGLDNHLRADATPTRSILLSQKAQMFPTPTASLADHGGPNQQDSSGRPGLTKAEMIWPTPTAYEKRGSKDVDRMQDGTLRKNGPNLGAAVKMMPTPTSRAGTGASETETRQGAADLQTVVGGQLNPEWVAWLMGFPSGWLNIGR